MVQVSKRSSQGDSIVECRIHDLLRDVATERAREDNFLMVCSTLDGMRSCTGVRRVAVHNLNCQELMKYASPNLRTLLCFNSDIPDCSRNRLLRVLSCTGKRIANLKSFEELSQLRYLMLGEYQIMWSQRSLEKSIGRMKFLQTLDLGGVDNNCSVDSLDCIWQIRTLRHVILPYWSSILGPPPSTDLPNLQTLLGVESRESWEHTNLPNVPNLRELRIIITEGFSWDLVVTFLHTLKNLVKLTIKGDVPTEGIDMRKFPFYEHLTLLSYEGRLSSHCFDVSMFPIYLTMLHLDGCKLQQDPMQVLEKLQGLKMLALHEAYSKQTMRCSAKGFPCLQFLLIEKFKELNKWEVEKGAMPMLKSLLVSDCFNIKVPPWLIHFTTLTHLLWNLLEIEESSPIDTKEIVRTWKF